MVLLTIATLVFGASYSFASAHGDEAHETEIASDPQLARMQQLITVLTQLIDLLEQKAALSGDAVADMHVHHHDETDHGTAEELKIWVEVHSYKPHAHVQRPGKELEEFFLEGVSYTDKAAVAKAIAEKTEFSEAEVAAILTLPEGELNEKGDSVDEDAATSAAEDVSGIHIMSDGMIMWGDGDEVEGATITADGKVKLSDGRIIEPKFDLR